MILGVIGIVAFGSINHGLGTETDAHHLTYLWTRGNWLAFFFFMAFSLILLSIFTSQLDAVLASRADLSAVPFDMEQRQMGPPPRNVFGKIASLWTGAMYRVRGFLESWTAAHDDKRIAWTLGIGWACCGGGLAGGCLVFAKGAYVVDTPLILDYSSIDPIESSLSQVACRTRIRATSSDMPPRYSPSSCSRSQQCLKSSV